MAANGDSLYSTGEGTGGPTTVPNTFRVVETHTITGGIVGSERTGLVRPFGLAVAPDGRIERLSTLPLDCA